MKWLAQNIQENDDATGKRNDRKPWVIMICDDDESVHAATKLALKHFSLNGRSLEFIDAFSGAEAIEIARDHDDIAVILMDVVMESESAGLDAVLAIRSELKNHLTRIILRTGHPGQAPEKEIIQKYDINDYKEKTDLTTKRLFTTVYTAVRSYRDLRSLARNRRGLENVIRGSTELLRSRGIQEFAEGVLIQMSGLINSASDGFFVREHGFASLEDTLQQPIVASTGRFKAALSLADIEPLDAEAYTLARRQFASSGTLFTENGFVHCISSPSNRRLLIYMDIQDSWGTLDREVLELFSHNVAVALDHLYLNRQIVKTQKELILMLGEAIESRSQESGNHVHRVAEYSALLAQQYGLDSEQVEILRMAAPLHDVGKIAIEDEILNKPGRHTPEESMRMQQHAKIGEKILTGYDLPILDAACVVAAEHHESWDGSGYPESKAGDDIHIFARIVSITDVFDALTSQRCYKQAWSIEKAMQFIESERAKKFDPTLVDLLRDNMPQFLEIRDQLKDPASLIN